MPRPEPASQTIRETPRCSRALHTLDLRLQTGNISPTVAVKKVRKGLEDVLAQMAVSEKDLDFHNAAEGQDQETRSHGKCTRNPLGHTSD